MRYQTNTSPTDTSYVGNGNNSYLTDSAYHSTTDIRSSAQRTRTSVTPTGYLTNNDMTSSYVRPSTTTMTNGTHYESRSVPTSPFCTEETAFRPYTFNDTGYRRQSTSEYLNNGTSSYIDTRTSANNRDLSSTLPSKTSYHDVFGSKYQDGNTKYQDSSAKYQDTSTSRTASPYKSSLKQTTFSTKEQKKKDLENVLDESESRRQLLVDKLDDARKTIQVGQNAFVI